MHRLLLALALGALLLGTPTLAFADDPPPATADSDGYVAPVCGDRSINSLSAADCTGEAPVPSIDPAEAADPPTVAQLEATAAAVAAAQPSPAELPAYCRIHANIVVYTSSDWVRVGEALQANASPCADYYISIPPLAGDKTALRCLQDDLIRALGPRFHPVAEFHFGGWNAWWNAQPGRGPAAAAHEFLRRVNACGYDFTLGETWGLNELHSGIRRDVPGARANMRILLNTLAAGAPEMPPSRGIIWVVGLAQGTLNLSEYKARLQEWFQDAPFWEDMTRDVWLWEQEAYGDMRRWGVADASREARTSNLNLFLEHPLLLAETGPQTVSTVRDFFEQTYAPLGTAAWPSNIWGYTDFGYDDFSSDQMKRFIAEQTFAVKHFSQTRPHVAPDGQFALAWAPNNTCTNDNPPPPTKPCINSALYAQITARILDRLASSIREAYEFGGGSQAGACGPPGDHSWCSANIPDAAFNPLWETFPDWASP